MSKAAVFFCLSPVVTASFADADGNLAAQPIDLPQLMLKGDLSMPQTEYVLKTGKFCRIRISSDGQEEFGWMSPELVRNARGQSDRGERSEGEILWRLQDQHVQPRLGGFSVSRAIRPSMHSAIV